MEFISSTSMSVVTMTRGLSRFSPAVATSFSSAIYASLRLAAAHSQAPTGSPFTITARPSRSVRQKSL